jgi:hypothetical protein
MGEEGRRERRKIVIAAAEMVAKIATINSRFIYVFKMI